MRLAKASPFGSNGDDRRQWRKQGGAVGAAASRMRAAAKQTLGAATRAVALRSNDGEGKPGTKEHLHSDKHWLLIESSYRCVFVLSQRPCPLSLTSFASSPKGGATGVSVSFRLDAESPTGRKRAGLATEGSDFWTSAPCQAVVSPDSGALPFPRHRALLVQWKPDRHASGSPFGGAGERSETERARMPRQNKNTAIR